jgi:4a-hydroxytetrahydrobiopterin dehydratase
MDNDQIAAFIKHLDGWEVVDEHHLRKKYDFKNFRKSLDFVDRVGRLAEEQKHHPDVCFGWGRAEITIWTHKINGLTESDFVLAAKIDKLRSGEDG